MQYTGRESLHTTCRKDGACSGWMEQLEEWPEEADVGRFPDEDERSRVIFGGNSGRGLYFVFRRFEPVM